MDAMTLPVKTDAAAALLKAMGNERRLCILLHLAHGEKSVGEMEALVGLSQSALSQHLAILRQEGLVRTRRQAQTIFYALKGDAPMEVLSLMRRLFPSRP
jgi:DNA-binding transcriptional ArsR family regulator